jgi:hypothetical protein
MAALADPATPASDPLPRVGARVRVVVPPLGPGWRTGMFNRTRQEPPGYLVLLFHPGPGRRGAVTVPLGAVTRLQVITLHPGTDRADPGPGASAHDGEEWREVALDAARPSRRDCPAAVRAGE